jgi:hypothetical protein
VGNSSHVRWGFIPLINCAVVKRLKQQAAADGLALLAQALLGTK